jgi:hypothetical protein
MPTYPSELHAQAQAAVDSLQRELSDVCYRAEGTMDAQQVTIDQLVRECKQVQQELDGQERLTAMETKRADGLKAEVDRLRSQKQDEAEKTSPPAAPGRGSYVEMCSFATRTVALPCFVGKKGERYSFTNNGGRGHGIRFCQLDDEPSRCPVVEEVVEDSAADYMGVRAGDVIWKCNGTQLKRMSIAQATSFVCEAYAKAEAEALDWGVDAHIVLELGNRNRRPMPLSERVDPVLEKNESWEDHVWTKDMESASSDEEEGVMVAPAPKSSES